MASTSSLSSPKYGIMMLVNEQIRTGTASTYEYNNMVS